MSAAVNRPTNEAQKEKDINQKLQLYGIYSAFANGKVPSNKQIDIAMNSALQSSALTKPSPKLSAEGRELIADLRDVIEKAKVLLLTKNEGNLLQDFIWRSQHIDGGNASLPNAPVDKDTAKQHGDQALEGLRVLGQLILSNGQFRKLLKDATVLLRDMAGDAAQKAADKVNPSQEQLSQIDRPAADNTWHETPDLTAGNIKAQAKEAYDKNIGIGKGDVKAAQGDASQAATGTRDPQDAAVSAQNEAQAGATPNVDGKSGVAAGAQTLVDRSNITEEDQERVKNAARATRENTKRYFKQKFPEERRDQIIFRLKKMIVEIQGHEDYQSAINTLLDLAEQYAGHTKVIAADTADTVKDAHSGDNDLRTAEKDLRTLLERFANSTSADDLYDAFNNIYRDADKDPELKNWFKHLDRYIRACLKEQGYVLTDKANDEGNQLYDQGEFLLRERYRDHVDRIVDEFNFIGQQFDQDPQNKAFANSMEKLFTDLGNDENGKPTFKPHLVKDLTEVIIPAIFENISYVPVPRLEYRDRQVDAIIENLVIESDNLFPNVLEVQSDNWFKWGRKSIVNRNKNKVMIAVSGVQMDLRNVSYYIHKKEGFPSIKDKGVMDIFLGGEGFGFKVALETADEKDRNHFFKTNTVKVDIKNLKLKLKQSNHKLLFNLFKPLLMGIVKPTLTKVLEKEIKNYIEQGDAFFWAVKQEAERALEEAADDPENAPNIYNRYYNAASRKITEGKKKTEDFTADKQANVAITQQDSMFKDIKLPGGISTKATEYKELAAKGDRWESPVFGIGSAKETTGLPTPAQITRKPHSTARGTLQGGTATYGGVGGAATTAQSKLPGNSQQYGTSSLGNNQQYGTSGVGNTSTTTTTQAYAQPSV